jgi:hypothetical protein
MPSDTDLEHSDTLFDKFALMLHDGVERGYKSHDRFSSWLHYLFAL